MSAFLCSTLHTLALAKFAVERGLADDMVSTAMRLRDANNKALAARYPRDKPQPLDELRPVAIGVFTDAQVNTMARSFRYQCSQGDVIETHPAAPLLARIIESTGGEHQRSADGFWSIG